jgi:hypothetical protein
MRERLPVLENFGRSMVPLLSAERTREVAADVDLCMFNTIFSKCGSVVKGR